MERDGGLWPSEIDAFPTELFARLLDATGASVDAVLSGATHTPGKEQTGGTSPLGSTSSTSTDHTTPTSTSPPPKKRQRVRSNNQRPKAEIDRLRRAVADLEKLLALAQQRARTGRLPPMLAMDDATRAQYSPNELMWMDVASRQYRYLREAQTLNESLRQQVLSQLQVVRNLTRIAQCAHAGIPSDLIPRTLSDPNASSFSFKRQELLGAVIQMYDSIEGVFGGFPFNSSTEELSDSTTYRFKNHVIPPRAPLASGLIRRYSPHSASEVGDVLWMLDPPGGREKEQFRVEHVQQTDDCQVVMGTVPFPGNAEGKCVIVRHLRVCDSTRRTIMVASSLWPSPANESPWNCVGTDTKQWIDVRDSSQLRDDGPLTEVRYRAEACKLADTEAAMAPSEAGLLVEFVTKITEFSLNYIHHRLDAMLLARNRVHEVDE